MHAIKRMQASEFIPCLFMKGVTDFLLIHFHANGEDAGQTISLMRRIQREFGFNVLCMEYPGYGVYPNESRKIRRQKKHIMKKKSDLILMDAQRVYDFFTKQLKVKQSNIIISGRSIGSGPACHLAARNNPKCLMLISPIKTVLGIAKKLCGKWADYLLEERFDNIQSASKIRLPIGHYSWL